MLAECLRRSRRLQSLLVPSNALGGASHGQLELVGLDDFHTSLEELLRAKIEGKHDEGLVALADALLENDSLTSLDLSGSCARALTARRIATAVLASPSLVHFSGIPLRELRANEVHSLVGSELQWGVPELHVIASLASSCTHLTSLKLTATIHSGVFIGDDGAVPLTQLIRVGHLKTLDIRGASRTIKDEYLTKQLVRAVLCSRTLRVFSGIPLCGRVTDIDLSAADETPRCGVVELKVLADVLHPRGARFSRSSKPRI